MQPGPSEDRPRLSWLDTQAALLQLVGIEVEACDGLSIDGEVQFRTWYAGTLCGPHGKGSTSLHWQLLPLGLSRTITGFFLHEKEFAYGSVGGLSGASKAVTIHRTDDTFLMVDPVLDLEKPKLAPRGPAAGDLATDMLAAMIYYGGVVERVAFEAEMAAIFGSAKVVHQVIEERLDAGELVWLPGIGLWRSTFPDRKLIAFADLRPAAELWEELRAEGKYVPQAPGPDDPPLGLLDHAP